MTLALSDFIYRFLLYTHYSMVLLQLKLYLLFFFSEMTEESYYGDPIVFSPELEIRLLPQWVRSSVSQLIDKENWKDIFALIPGQPWSPGNSLPEGSRYPRKYTHDDIRFDN